MRIATITELGEWLKRRMADRGLTYNATAVYAGIGQATISDIINKGHIPRVDTLHRLADFFGTSHTEVLRLAGLLDDDGPMSFVEEVAPETRQELYGFYRLIDEIRAVNPDAADQLIRSTHVMAEAVRTALAAQEKNATEEEVATNSDK